MKLRQYRKMTMMTEEEQGIDTDDDSNGNTNLQGSIDIETNTEFDDEEDIEVWYAKAKLFLDNVNTFGRVVYEHPGFNLSLDEMMKYSRTDPL